MRESLSDSVIAATALTKRFGKVIALDGLDLNVRRGEVHGFLGPNGAGKSTTIRALLGQIRLDSGKADIFGMDVWRDYVAIHERLAYVPGDVVLWPRLTGGQCIDLLGRLQGSRSLRRRNELIERFDLDPSRRAATYSKGNRQKVSLIAALATDAELLLLDEPTSGLDPLMEVQFQETIREVAQAGRTVLLSSHILSEVEALCENVSIVRRGRIVEEGSLARMRQASASHVEARTLHELRLPGVTDLRVVRDRDYLVTRFSAAGTTLNTALATVVAANPMSVTVAPPSLSELFLDHYEDDLAEPNHDN